MNKLYSYLLGPAGVFLHLVVGALCMTGTIWVSFYWNPGDSGWGWVATMVRWSLYIGQASSLVYFGVLLFSSSDFWRMVRKGVLGMPLSFLRGEATMALFVGMAIWAKLHDHGWLAASGFLIPTLFNMAYVRFLIEQAVNEHERMVGQETLIPDYDIASIHSADWMKDEDLGKWVAADAHAAAYPAAQADVPPAPPRS